MVYEAQVKFSGVSPVSVSLSFSSVPPTSTFSRLHAPSLDMCVCVSLSLRVAADVFLLRGVSQHCSGLRGCPRLATGSPRQSHFSHSHLSPCTPYLIPALFFQQSVCCNDVCEHVCVCVCVCVCVRGGGGEGQMPPLSRGTPHYHPP